MQVVYLCSPKPHLSIEELRDMVGREAESFQAEYFIMLPAYVALASTGCC